MPAAFTIVIFPSSSNSIFLLPVVPGSVSFTHENISPFRTKQLLPKFPASVSPTILIICWLNASFAPTEILLNELSTVTVIVFLSSPDTHIIASAPDNPPCTNFNFAPLPAAILSSDLYLDFERAFAMSERAGSASIVVSQVPYSFPGPSVSSIGLKFETFVIDSWHCFVTSLGVWLFVLIINIGVLSATSFTPLILNAPVIVNS
ncbi:Uncharacterised protein [uncultured archaeon]|nr:Uncharacterised protein [uncultured archaeon]